MSIGNLSDMNFGTDDNEDKKLDCIPSFEIKSERFYVNKNESPAVYVPVPE